MVSLRRTLSPTVVLGVFLASFVVVAAPADALTHRVSAARRRWWDLVSFRSHGRVHHVGIYAGRNRIWHALSPGRSVQRERLSTSRVTYGRVR